jgi:hypothetical protein
VIQFNDVDLICSNQIQRRQTKCRRRHKRVHNLST